ncbi:nucleotidyl transferase AbiEii/AbiGii toxin family protein [Herbaspirillum frisingense]|uniref:nucleotidyl transferase AbiEii/AbiGii toxin family protein n=1 Tax=Herbaspirillum frisingense TaxID=92645 RepID=UPI001F3BA026|nr:nucleotidyl transferase AbiEii/AbiGii toxin family protein [Herbaspirillum frisingense]UIN20800.1 hypothetical protein LAZ82_20375 [Herbaspirillum frisingense]
MEAVNHKLMIEQVATALGPDMLQQMAFVGGCTTALLLTDEYAIEQVRHTDDVDLIVHLIGRAEWPAFREKILARGFREAINDNPICSFMLGALRVDFMPDEGGILGFTNRWYSEALESAISYQLNQEITIRLVSPPYFIATKLEAFAGRGTEGALWSRDIEDIITLIDGRESLQDELSHASPQLRAYISEKLAQLLQDRDFEFAVSGNAQNEEREALIFERIEKIINI